MSAHGKRLLQREFWSLVATGLMLASPSFSASAGDLQAPVNVATKHTASKPVVGSGNATKPKTSLSANQTAVRNSTTKPTALAKPVVKSPPQKTAAKLAPATSPRPTIRPAISNSIATGPIRRVAQAQGGAAAAGFDRSLLDDGTFWREQGSDVTWQQTGMASWYGGPRWQGKKTTSGERYDQNKLTAAHATLPIGTQVRVVRTDGRGSVVVTINDRPGTRTRIIDLSRAAAKELGILNAGVTMVTLQPL